MHIKTVARSSWHVDAMRIARRYANPTVVVLTETPCRKNSVIKTIANGPASHRTMGHRPRSIVRSFGAAAGRVLERLSHDSECEDNATSIGPKGLSSMVFADIVLTSMAHMFRLKPHNRMHDLPDQ